ncbi:MAG: D-alanine--D-alanine ligase [Gammaproteobacteria bacterium]|nr:D-alanine--D-alanine ligase [Gammaproteobacteria bacterium]
MNKKISLGILFGGRSCEHEVSVTSARSMLRAVDLEKYDVTLIGIDKYGHWLLTSDFDAIVENGSVRPLSAQPVGLDEGVDETLGDSPYAVSLSLHDRGNLATAQNGANALSSKEHKVPVLDVIFPVLHGTFGEDGALQGVVEMAGITYVGCGVLASSLCMDKAVAKKVFEAEGIPQAPYHVIVVHDWHSQPDEIMTHVSSDLGYPVFVKPANMGSSVGINKAHDKDQLKIAIDHALEFDTKAVVEKSMENCREIECAVLGNHAPEPSVLGEIIPGADFYNYETKYLDQKSQLVIPAELSKQTANLIRELSVKAFRAVDGAGLSRVDFFVEKESEKVYLNEINTMPGFTPISMYPQLWAASGLSYCALIDRLIALALERHHTRGSLRRAF